MIPSINPLSNPFQFAQNAAGEYDANPAEQLATAMTGMDIPTTPTQVEAAINGLAEREGISRAEAAYSFARAAEEDTTLVPDWSIGGNNLAENRAAEFARKHFKGDNAATARAAIADDKLVVNRITNTTTNLGKVERQIQKLKQQNKPIPSDVIRERDGLKQELVQLYEQHRTKDNK